METLALAVAAWMRWQSGRTRSGRGFAVHDPLAALTAAAVAGGPDDRARVAALLSIVAIFPRDLAADPRFGDTLQRCYRQLGSGRPPLLDHPR